MDNDLSLGATKFMKRVCRGASTEVVSVLLQQRADSIRTEVDDGLDGSASSWAYRFAIVGKPVNAVRRFAVKVNGSDGKIGSNKARH